jgi:hypothetical protein
METKSPITHQIQICISAGSSLFMKPWRKMASEKVYNYQLGRNRFSNREFLKTFPPNGKEIIELSCLFPIKKELHIGALNFSIINWKIYFSKSRSSRSFSFLSSTFLFKNSLILSIVSVEEISPKELISILKPLSSS